LALGKPVKLVAPFHPGIFQNHPLVETIMTVCEALNLNPDDCLS
jgi:hypothetical protein